MATNLTRRSILKALGIGTAALALEPILEPAKKLWFVGSNAPVGSRIEHLDAVTARTWSLKIQLSEEALEDERMPALLDAARAVKKSMHAQMDRDVADQVSALDRFYGQARGGGKVGYRDDLEVGGPGVMSRDFYAVDLSEGSEWSFENGTRIRFGSGGNPEPAWRIESIDHAQDTAHVNLRVTQQFAERDMDLADRYAQQIRAAAPSIREALLKGRWYVQG